MKNIVTILFCASLISSCSKAPQSPKLIFTVNATYDSSNTTGNVVNVDVAKTSGDDDYVNLRVEGLPDYISADYMASNMPPFSTAIRFKLSTFAQKDIRKWTNYTATVTATSNAGIKRSTEVTFFCYPEDPTQAFDALDFRAVEDCTPTGGDTRSVTSLTAGGNKIILTDFFVTDIFHTVTLPAFVDGRKRTLTIPPFTQDGYTFRGGGTFFTASDGTLACKIDFSRSSTGLFDTCRMQLNQFY